MITLPKDALPVEYFSFFPIRGSSESRDQDSAKKEVY